AEQGRQGEDPGGGGAEPLGGDARRADLRGARLPGRGRRQLVGRARAGKDASRDRRQAQYRVQRGGEGPGGAPAARGPRRVDDRRHARGPDRADRERDRALAQGGRRDRRQDRAMTRASSEWRMASSMLPYSLLAIRHSRTRTTRENGP